MTRKRWVLILAGGGALLALLVAGGIGLNAYAAANTAGAIHATSPSTYCQLYESTLASQLGTTTAKLQSADQAARKAVLDQMVKDGKITQAQETQIEQKQATRANAACAAIGSGFAAGGPRGNLGPALKGARSSIESAVASAAGISTTTLESDLANGQSIAQIAGSKLSAVNTAYLGAVQTALNSAVSQGTITSAQSTSIYSMVSKTVQAGHYPLLGPPHGHGMNGMMPPPGGPGAAGTMGTQAGTQS